MRNNSKIKNQALLDSINYDDEGPGMLGVAIIVMLMCVFAIGLWQEFS